MYQASSDFHEAVAAGAHQIALLIFSDAVFTNADINVSVGIEFNDYFNTEENLAIGQALSNEISFNLFNDSGLLNEYEFGDFLATIGVQIGEETVTASGKVRADSAGHSYVAYDSSPYLKRDGVAVSQQPGVPVRGILIYGGYVYCRLINNAVAVYRDSDGAIQPVTVNKFMKAQMVKWAGEGISYADRILTIRKDTNLKTYEFVPLGYFTAERPNVPNKIEISIHSYDFMQKFEKDMPDDATLGITYPCTFSNLFVKMCQYAGVNYASSTFINSTATISARPEEFDRVTMREVLQWLAEAAASVARFNRDGELEMAWLKTTDLEIDESGYTTFEPYWYQTTQVTRLCNRSSSGAYDNYSGSGDETYLIQDNPLLKGVS